MAILRRSDPFDKEGRGGVTGWMRDHHRVVREALYHVSARIITSLIVWLLVGIALALPAGLYLLQLNLADVGADWDGRPGLSVYFKVDAEAGAMPALAERLRAEAYVQEVEETSPVAALEAFNAHTGLSDALDLLENNPLPASLRAMLINGATVPDLERLAAIAESAPGVQEVVVEKTWLERVSDITTVVSRLSVVLALLFGIGALLVTATSVRLAIEARLEELKVQTLVGATERQLRRPFLYFGAIYGAGGALVALMLISMTLLVVETPLARLAGSYGASLEFAGFDPVFLLSMLATGSALGVVGALLAARQRLHELEVL